jgi:hypothetical protein
VPKRASAGAFIRRRRTDFGGAQLPHVPHLFPAPSQPLRTQTSHSPSADPAAAQPRLISHQAYRARSHLTRTTLNLTSSAPETALVCQSRISKLSTRSRKRMKIPVRSSRVSKTTFIFVSNVRPVPDNCTRKIAQPAVRFTCKMPHTAPSLPVSARTRHSPIQAH